MLAAPERPRRGQTRWREAEEAEEEGEGGDGEEQVEEEGGGGWGVPGAALTGPRREGWATDSCPL